MNVKNVGRPLGRGHILLSIKEFILVRNPMNIRNVENLQMEFNTTNIKNCTLKRNCEFKIHRRAFEVHSILTDH